MRRSTGKKLSSLNQLDIGWLFTKKKYKLFQIAQSWSNALNFQHTPIFGAIWFGSRVS